MTRTRTESDSFGPIDVPIDALWGAQTARSLHFFAIGEQRMPLPVIHALAWVKWAAAVVNGELYLLDGAKSQAIASAAQRVAKGEFDTEFPLSAWQTGPGTQSNMNANEVVAHLAGPSVHPNDDVNLGQSSNDVFPSAMHMALVLHVRSSLQPALALLRSTLSAKAIAFKDIIKIGRTHLQDATPITLVQELGGYEAQLGLCADSMGHSLLAVHRLAIGGTAVGTGFNTHPEFGARVAAKLAQQLDLPLRQADNFSPPWRVMRRWLVFMPA